ncbi:LysM peptidoglycan-binding domain-containing protein [Alloscardovia theropitheci]|nr:LysM peptidoglycan-binding domain-containing protein [Alloscardovia theropitheci]
METLTVNGTYAAEYDVEENRKRQQAFSRHNSQSRVKLNQRGKFVVWSLVVAVVATMAFIFIPQATAQSEVVETVSYTVQPNDTLWDYASRITPAGADVYDTIAQIKRINHLDSDQLTAGQTLLVPEA